MSKNNWREMMQQQEPKKQRFTLKKLTIGVASVLLGMTFMSGTMVKADTDPSVAAKPTVAADTDANKDSGQISQATDENTVPDSQTTDGNSRPTSQKTNENVVSASQATKGNQATDGHSGQANQLVKGSQTASDVSSKATSTTHVETGSAESASQSSSAHSDATLNVADKSKNSSAASIVSPDVMLAKKPEVEARSTDPEDQVTMTIHFVDHDESDKSIGSKIISGQAGEDVTDQVKADYQSYFDQHYEMLMDDPLGIAWYTGFDGKKIELPDSNQSYTVPLSHQVEMLFGDPTDPQCYGRTIPVGGSKDGITQNDLERHFTRTIVFHYKDGTTKKYVQTMNPNKTAYRHVTVDLVDPSLDDFSDWSIKNVDVEKLGFAELSDDDLAKYNPQDEEIWEKGRLQPIFSVPEIGFYDLDKDFGEQSNINVDLYVGQCNFNFKYEDALKGQNLHSDYIDDHTDNNDVWQVGVNPAPDSSYNFKEQMQFDASGNLEEVAQFPGYQLTGAIVDGQTVKGTQAAIQRIGDLTNEQDHNITLEYTHLAPVYIHYRDIDTNQDIFQLYIPTDQMALPADPTGQFDFQGDNYVTNPITKLDYPELDDAENYQPNIPGYTYTGQSKGTTSGIVGQTYKSQDDPNPIDVYYYYKVGKKVDDPIIAKYSREHPQFGQTLNADLHPKQPPYIGDPIDYTEANQGLINYLKETGANYVGGINTAGGISTITENDTWYYFLANRDVKVNYVNEATGEVMESGYADRVTATSNLADSTDHDLPTTPQDQDPDNNLNGKWTTRKLQFTNMVFDKTDRSTSGIYGALQQEVNYYYLPEATKHTDTKTATRLIHYVANTADGEPLQRDVTQKVTLKGTYFTDANDQLVWGTEAKDSKGNLIKDADGHQVYVVDTSKSGDAQETWTIDTDSDIKDNHDVTANKTDDQTFDFSKAAGDEAPTVISVDSTWSKDHHNVNTGKWYYVSEVNNNIKNVDPSSEDWQDALDPITLVYEQQVQAVTPKKTATRTVYYVEADNSDPTKATKLTGYDNTGTKADHFVQKVTLVTNNTYDIDGKQTTFDTYYIDPSDPTKKVNVKTVKDADGIPIYVVDRNDNKAVKVTWVKDNKANDNNDVTDNDGKFTFTQPTNQSNVTEAPDTIADPTDPTNAKKTWYHVATLDKNNQSEDLTDPAQTWTDASGKETDSKTLDSVYLVYKQKAGYNVHYVDVTGHTDDYSKGTELTGHLVSGVGRDNKDTAYYVGDTPDATAKLWAANGDQGYNKAGYILIGMSDNAKDGKLGKQQLSVGIKDQYVYLLRRAIQHTDDTKTATRVIHYVANNENGEPLQNDITQKLTLKGTYYTDATDPTERVFAVAAKNADGTLVKDAAGKQIYVVDTTSNSQETWTVDDHDTSSDRSNDQTFDFAKAKDDEAPSTINVSSDWAKHHNVNTGDWYYISADNNVTKTVDPAKDWVSGKNDLTLEPITLIYQQQVRAVTPQKTATRTVYYVEDDNEDLTKATKLKGYDNNGTKANHFDQKVTLITINTYDVDGKHVTSDTYYVGPTNPTKKVDVQTVKDANGNILKGKDGNPIYVVDDNDSKAVTTTWVIDNKSPKNDVESSKDKFIFAKPTNKPSITEVPNTIVDPVKPTDDKLTWYHVSSLDQNDKSDDTTNPSQNWQDANGNEINDKTLDPVYLVYKQKASYNVHYLDVTGLTTDNYSQGIEFNGANKVNGQTLVDHEIKNIGKDTTDTKTYYVGDTPNYSNKTWKTYGDEGYVLVGTKNVDADHPLADQKLDSTNIQDQYVYLMRIAQQQHESKAASRLVYTVAYDPTTKDISKWQQLPGYDNGKSGSFEQKVTLDGTYYTDASDSKSKTKVGYSQIKVNGKYVTVVDPVKKGTETWSIDNRAPQHDVVKNNDQQFEFKMATGDEIPTPIRVDQQWSANNNVLTGIWYHVVTLDQHNVNEMVAPATDWATNNSDLILDPVYLGYEQKAQYNIHYLDVTGLQPADYLQGQEIKKHEVLDIGNGANTYIGDTPDFTDKLWRADGTDGYKAAGYILVGVSANAGKDQLGHQTLTPDVQDQYVYLKHGVTPSTHKTPKEEIKSENVFVKRHIYYRDAQTGLLVRDELKKYGITADVPDVIQTVDYVRVPLYDAFDGNFLGFAALFVNPNGFAELDKSGQPEIKKDKNGQPLILTKDGKQSWVPTGIHNEYPKQDSPDLTKYGYEKANSLVQSKDKGDGAVVDQKASDPTKDGDDVNVYYFHDEEPVTPSTPQSGIDKKELEKTFTRKIVYRGTRNGGKSYQSVNGAPDGQNYYIQTVTFTRKATIDKVTKKVLKYTKWTLKSGNMSVVPSKAASKVDYKDVDIPSVNAADIDPNSTKTDLGTTVVTYTINQPSTPDKPDTPNNPGKKPDNPSKPGQPNTPGKTPDHPDKPVQPNTPGKTPDNPGKPGQPNTPGKTPDNPGKPGQPNTPGKTPDNPGKPVQPNTPSKTPDNPEKPGQPSIPGKTPTNPNKPVTPSMPDKPNVPSIPDNPSSPSKQNDSSTPTTPGGSNHPSTPQTLTPSTPSESSQSSKPVKPSIPVHPSAPSEASHSTAPSTSTNQSAPSKPNQPSIPSTPSQPSTSPNSDNPSEPSEPLTPSTPVTSSIPTTTSQPMTPSEVGHPTAPTMSTALVAPSMPNKPLTPNTPSRDLQPGTMPKPGKPHVVDSVLPSTTPVMQPTTPVNTTPGEPAKQKLPSLKTVAPQGQSSESQTRLPQTGNDTKSKLVQLIGLATAGMMGMFSLAGFKKKQDK